MSSALLMGGVPGAGAYPWLGAAAGVEVVGSGAGVDGVVVSGVALGVAAGMVVWTDSLGVALADGWAVTGCCSAVVAAWLGEVFTSAFSSMIMVQPELVAASAAITTPPVIKRKELTKPPIIEANNGLQYQAHSSDHTVP